MDHAIARRLRRIMIVVFLLFVALFISTTIIQFFCSGQLDNDGRNKRTVYDSYQVERGTITAGDVTVANSTPVNNNYRFTRNYPAGMAYAPITGYFSHTLAPTGIEAAENSTLSGSSQSSSLTQLFDRISGSVPSGEDVKLSIDPKVQQAAWDALGDRKGAAVALNPKTGQILAMVSKPSYDPTPLASNDPTTANQAYNALDQDPNKPLINRAIGGDTYPPGSTFKLVVSAAALDNGYTPDSTFPNPSSLTLTGTDTQIHNDTLRSCGGISSPASIKLALQYSCNIPFAELGAELGQDKIGSVASAFGFNKSYNIPLPVTASKYPSNMNAPQVQMSSFGEYDVRATPLQVAMVSAGIANGGNVMQPTLIDQISSPDLKTSQKTTPKVFSQAISGQVAATLTNMMVNNVSSGQISNARIQGVDVAGKTGTAETTKDAQYTLWFTGFAPANDPQVAVAVAVEGGGTYNNSQGSNIVAAPIARQIMEAVLNK